MLTLIDKVLFTKLFYNIEDNTRDALRAFLRLNKIRRGAMTHISLIDIMKILKELGTWAFYITCREGQGVDYALIEGIQLFVKAPSQFPQEYNVLRFEGVGENHGTGKEHPAVMLLSSAIYR
ncbi:hypothetical protein TNCV_4990541 [Trichonephila clavipes]|nr:hypothetical protein TNCV_4990541 [Trichonephila clavipes]